MPKKKAIERYMLGCQIKSVSDFSKSNSQMFLVYFGSQQKFLHRSFLISQQYRTLEMWCARGMIFEVIAKCK